MNNWPLVLPHAHVARILKHNASRLIVTSRIRTGSYDVQDALTVRRNDRKRKAGRFSEQEHPSVFAIKITDICEFALVELDLGIVRAAGFRTQRDFYDDWLERRRWICPDEPVRVCAFVFEAPERYLHRRVHRGYTTNPADGAKGECAALSASELRDLSAGAAKRLERERRQETMTQRARSLQIRLKDALKRQEVEEARRLSLELADLLADWKAA
jgi:hypothetical protein